VDGYNIDLAIIMIPNGASNVPAPNLSNPSCVASIGGLANASFNPYTSGSQMFLGTSSSDPLPFDQSVTANEVSTWCPWDLQVTPPTAPGNGVYPYPDSNIQRPAFDPCYSACAKYSQDSYCCTGKYDSPNSCKTNYYSQAAKKVCPDAYSYAYDDQTSTFITPTGPGFQVVFCPGGRSTTIISNKSNSSSTSNASPSSGGAFSPSIGRTHPILDALKGTSGVAVLVSLVTMVITISAF